MQTRAYIDTHIHSHFYLSIYLATHLSLMYICMYLQISVLTITLPHLRSITFANKEKVYLHETSKQKVENSSQGSCFPSYFWPHFRSFSLLLQQLCLEPRARTSIQLEVQPAMSCGSAQGSAQTGSSFPTPWSRSDLEALFLLLALILSFLALCILSLSLYAPSFNRNLLLLPPNPLSDSSPCDPPSSLPVTLCPFFPLVFFFPSSFS